jgi:hypothetical protein
LKRFDLKGILKRRKRCRKSFEGNPIVRALQDAFCEF